jgi:hypothetical protein
LNCVWKGVSVGGALGVGIAGNIGTGFLGASYSKQLTPSVPTLKRSFMDIGSNWYNNSVGKFIGLPKL